MANFRVLNSTYRISAVFEFSEVNFFEVYYIRSWNFLRCVAGILLIEIHWYVYSKSLVVRQPVIYTQKKWVTKIWHCSTNWTYSRSYFWSLMFAARALSMSHFESRDPCSKWLAPILCVLPNSNESNWLVGYLELEDQDNVFPQSLHRNQKPKDDVVQVWVMGWCIGFQFPGLLHLIHC
jgi:hypothetical protein